MQGFGIEQYANPYSPVGPLNPANPLNPSNPNNPGCMIVLLIPLGAALVRLLS